PVTGEQGGELGHLHGLSLLTRPSGTWPHPAGESDQMALRRGGSAAQLALALRECQPSSYTGVSTLGMRVLTSLLISVKKEEVHRVGFHQAARGPHRHPAGRGRADHRKRS